MFTDYRNIPETVRARLGQRAGVDLSEPTPGFDLQVRRGLWEARRYHDVTIRRDDNDQPIFEGYATVYDVEYEVFGGPPYGWTESIASGACDKSVRERDDVRLLVNHDSASAFGVALARTKSKTLTLGSDTIGLRTEAPLDTANPVVAGLVSAMDRGDIDEMSFAFRVIRQEWNEEYTERTIREVRIVDVAAVTFPANPAALAQLRGEELTDPEPAAERIGMTAAQARAIMNTYG